MVFAPMSSHSRAKLPGRVVLVPMLVVIQVQSSVGSFVQTIFCREVKLQEEC